MSNSKHNPVSNFWSKVTPLTESQCWTWRGSKTPKGYGTFWANNKSIYAHRFSYELENGDIPKGQLVLHSCDNPSCVNPAHLSLGTYSNNTQQMDQRKRRGKKGSSFSMGQIKKMQELKSKGARVKDMCAVFSVSEKHCYNLLKIVVPIITLLIVTGCETFADVVGAPPPTTHLKYQNPSMPNPILPLNLSMRALALALKDVESGEIRLEEYACMSHNDGLDLLAWIKANAHWQERAKAVVKFHEEQNK